jgi:hypothetical protein
MIIKKPESKRLRKAAMAILGTILTVSGGVATNRVEGKWWLQVVSFAAAVFFLVVAAMALRATSDEHAFKVSQRKLRKVRTRLVEKVLPRYYGELAVDVQMRFEEPIGLEVPAFYKSLRLGNRSRAKSSTDGPSGIEQAYEQSSGSLLVLGKAGSGKTHSVVRLIRLLLERARQKEIEPIPFYLNLSQWDGRSALKEWCISAISAEYGPRREYVSEWLDEDDLVIIFDGLDELPRKERLECMASINSFRQSQRLLGLVVTSRDQEYFDSGRHLLLMDSCNSGPFQLMASRKCYQRTWTRLVGC